MFFLLTATFIIITSGGGMLVAKDADLVVQARFLATQARDAAPHYHYSEIGYNRPMRKSKFCYQKQINKTLGLTKTKSALANTTEIFDLCKKSNYRLILILQN